METLFKLYPNNATAIIPTITFKILETRNWDDKDHFSPIDRNEMNKNPKLIQNPDYN